MTSSGHAFSQFMHMWHSSWRHLTPPCGLSAPWQWTRHRLQSVHFAWSFVIPKSAKREKTPRNAPSGQRTRHQKRGMKRFAKRTATRRKTMNQVWWK